MSKVNYEIKDGHLILGGDTNEDGQNSVGLKLSLNEAVEEAFKKGEAVEGVKVAQVKFLGTQLQVLVDTDKDGEQLLELTLDIGEILDEAGVFK